MYIGLEHVNKSFGQVLAADDVSFGVEKGSLTALLGSSGSGKTTILRMIAGLETPDSGDILIGGERVNDVPAKERGIGFVFQNYALFRYMTVYENIAFGLEIKKAGQKQCRERVTELLELTGLTGLEKRYPNELSGGQKQRVAFARALAPEPQVLLLDEPFAAIDAKVRQELRAWLREMIYRVGITSIFVTHDQEEAVEVADQIVVVHEGRVEQAGSAREIYQMPKTPFVAEFIGQSVMIEHFGLLTGFDQGDYQGAIIRPAFVEAFKADNTRFQDFIACSDEGVITDILFRGNALEVKLDVHGLTLTAHRSLERRKIEVGERMRVIVYRLIAFDGNQTVLLENSELKKADMENSPLQNYLYGSDGYFVM